MTNQTKPNRIAFNYPPPYSKFHQLPRGALFTFGVNCSNLYMKVNKLGGIGRAANLTLGEILIVPADNTVLLVESTTITSAA